MTTVDALRVQLLSIAVLSLSRQLYHNRGLNRVFTSELYDFVIIGGGTAGSIVAGRLSENPNVTVLLLEAGGPLTITTDMMPAFFYFNYNWGYQTTPQQQAGLGLHNRRVFYPRGKILGGSHAINNAVFSRGNSRDYDSWASVYGATGWSFADVMSYFLRSENNTDPAIVAANPAYHSTSGPVQVSTIPNLDPIMLRWTEAVTRLGWPQVDLNGPQQLGTAIMQTTQSNQNWTRQTTAAAYIEPYILQRTNLHVLTNSLVTRILFRNSSSGQAEAYGVEFKRDNGQIQTVTARREVIVSGGAINTPQLLMLSGIGPQWHLAQFGIPLVADLPVGDNLQDHVSTGMDFLVRNQSDIGWSGNTFTMMNAANLADFLVRSYGPLTRLPLSETYVPTGVNGDKDWPDGMIYAMVSQINPDIETVLNAFDQGNRDAWQQYFTPLAGNNRRFALAFSSFRSATRGTVRLASADPNEPPLIDPMYFSDLRDLATLVRTMSVALQIAENKLMAPYIQYTPVPVPGCPQCPEKALSQCYVYLACVAKTMTTTSFHPVGTCHMGNQTNEAAVVDQRLRVRKVRNLRVIDASVMPSIPNSNTNAPTMMVAERGADLIREDHQI